MPKRTRETRRPVAAITGYGDLRRASRGYALRSLGQVVYAARCAGGVIKIGCTTNLANRLSGLQATELLGFVPGNFADEHKIHEQLVAHLDHGREWYLPTAEVLAVVNDMRATLGLDPLAA